MTAKTIENFDTVVAEIADMTDNNDHTGAIIYAAEWLELPPHQIKSLKTIEGTVRQLGFMTPALDRARKGYYDIIMDRAKHVLNVEDFNKFHGVF